MANIKIIVERFGAAEKESENNRGNPRGIIKRKRNDDYLPRRLSAAVSGWKFYDLGQIAVEDYFDDLHFTANANNVFHSDEPVTTDSLQLSDLTAKASYYTAKTQTELKNEHLQILPVNADVFLITITTPFANQQPLDSNSARWQNGSIKIEDNENPTYLIVRGNPLFAQIYIDTRDNFRQYGEKVTTEPLFTADESASFTISKQAEFYLCPAFGSINFSASGQAFYPHDRSDIFDSAGYNYNFYQELFLNYHTFPRNELVEWITLWRSFNFLLSKSLYGYTAASYGLFRAVAQTLFQLYGGEILNYAQLDGKYNNGTDENDNPVIQDKRVYELDYKPFPNPDLFPAPPSLPEINSYGTPGDYKAYWNAQTASGDLLMIIYQEKEFFYVWKR